MENNRTTYQPGFAVSPMDTINLIGWEAQQLAEYIKHPPVVRGEDGQLRVDISDHEILRRAARLFGFAQDVNSYADGERAKIAGANGAHSEPQAEAVN